MFDIFSCCLHRRNASEDNPDQPDERTHLIPSSPIAVTPVIDSATTKIDARQRRNERYNSLVRTSEAKMVNVNVNDPFVLRTESPGPNTRHPHNSSSHSLSFSASSRSVSHIDVRNAAQYSRSHFQLRVGAPMPTFSQPPSAASSIPPLVHYAGLADTSRSPSREGGDRAPSGPSPLPRPRPGFRLVRLPLEGAGDSTSGRGRHGQRASLGGSGGAEGVYGDALTSTDVADEFDLSIDMDEETRTHPSGSDLFSTNDPEHAIDAPRKKYQSRRVIAERDEQRSFGDPGLEISVSAASTASLDTKNTGHEQRAASGTREEGSKPAMTEPVQISAFVIKFDKPLTISFSP